MTVVMDMVSLHSNRNPKTIPLPKLQFTTKWCLEPRVSVFLWSKAGAGVPDICSAPFLPPNAHVCAHTCHVTIAYV